MNIFQEKSEPKIFDFGIDETARVYLLQTARWTKFLAIIGFIALGLMMVGGVFIMLGFAAGGAFQSAFLGASAILFFAYLFIALIYFYPTLELYRFSKAIKAAIATADTQLLNTALRHQRNMFRFVAILVIILLGLYGIGILAAVTIGSFL